VIRDNAPSSISRLRLLKRIALSIFVMGFAISVAVNDLGINALNQQPWLAVRWLISAAFIISLLVWLLNRSRTNRSEGNRQ